MQNTNDINRPAGIVIEQGFTVQAARLSGSDSIRVDGTVIGNVNLAGSLHLSGTGTIEGDVQVLSAIISGRVTGTIVCKDTLHMSSTAVIMGDVITNRVIVDKGAALRGRCKTLAGNAG